MSADNASSPAPPSSGLLDDAAVRAAEPVLLAYAQRAVADASVARDLVQDTLLAALQGQARFDGRSQVRTWLVSILSHKIIDHFRRNKRWRPLEADLEDEGADLLQAPPTSSPEHAASRRQALGVVERALSTLTPRERVAVLLVDVEGVERTEACNVLGVRATHLRILLHRGRHRLRIALENAGLSPRP